MRQWIESSLYFHISRPTCCPCSGYHRLEIKISVQWRDPHYLICSYIGGKLKQCVLSLETGLQSKRYTHCQIISRLCTVTQLVPLAASHTDKIYNVISQKIPAWLFHSDELFRLHFLICTLLNRMDKDKDKITIAVPFRNRWVPYYTYEHVSKFSENICATATSAIACCGDPSCQSIFVNTSST